MNIVKGGVHRERKEKGINKRCIKFDGLGHGGPGSILRSTCGKQMRFIFNSIWYYITSCRETPTVWRL
jgi:hypothetical protein